MRANNASVALVTSKDGQFGAADVQGVITRKDILDTLADDMELFSGCAPRDSRGLTDVPAWRFLVKTHFTIVDAFSAAEA